MSYGQSLKQFREDRGLTQLQLSREVHISHQNLNRWERDLIIPRVDFCVRLADFYKISIDELIGRKDY